MLLALLLGCNTLCGQVTDEDAAQVPLPGFLGWQDNDHYLLSRRNPATARWETFAVDVRTGRELPARRPDTPKKAKAVEEATPRFSPDGQWMAFTRNHDLYARHLETGREVRYTHDGSDTLLNGYASWVYYEEILRRDSEYAAIWWSPDSKYIAFYRFDESRVPLFPLYNAEGQHGRTEWTRYPKAGDPNPAVSVGIVPVEGGEVVWAELDPKDDHYLGPPYWRPDASELVVQWMSRGQDHLKLYGVAPQTGGVRELYDEQYPTWIDWIRQFAWLPDGSFLMVRPYEGWEQIYLHCPDGQLKARLTEGRNWNTRILRVDRKHGRVFYCANGEAATRTDLYVARLDGKGQRRLTPGNYHHGKFYFSPDASYVVTTYSNCQTPPRMDLIDTATGRTRRVADSLDPLLDTTDVRPAEMVWIKSEDGRFDLPGRIRWPRKMEPGRRYPVLIHIYGGPNHATVKDVWSPVRELSKEEECIRLSIDHRGAGTVGGKQGLDDLHRQLGRWEIADYIAWAKWLRTRPEVDADRILISGGSYGGYLTLLALTVGAEYFHYGIADYPVTDWLFYDSHYTERYMDAPTENPEGYKEASVLTHAHLYCPEGGGSRLLIQQGMMDDNVHAQHVLRLIDLWQHQDKPFELMIYPNERHGWKRKIPFTNGVREQFRRRWVFTDK